MSRKRRRAASERARSEQTSKMLDIMMRWQGMNGANPGVQTPYHIPAQQLNIPNVMPPYSFSQDSTFPNNANNNHLNVTSPSHGADVTESNLMENDDLNSYLYP
jgi:hypothetical protein